MNYPRYHIKIGYADVFYGTTFTLTQFDGNQYIWDDHIRKYVDADGEVLEHVSEIAPAKLLFTNESISDDLIKQLKKLNEISSQYDSNVSDLLKM